MSTRFPIEAPLLRNPSRSDAEDVGAFPSARRPGARVESKGSGSDGDFDTVGSGYELLNPLSESLVDGGGIGEAQPLERRPSFRINTFKVKRFASSLDLRLREHESYDYSLAENEVKRREQARETETSVRRKARMRWYLTFAVAVVTALLGCGVTYMGRQSENWLIQLGSTMISAERNGRTFHAAWFCVYASVSLACTLVAACIVVFVEPLAAGSGVPEIKSVLNGIAVRRSMRIRTFLSKAVGIIFSVAGGLPVGLAGTVIHCGAIVGAGLSQGKSTTMGFDTNFTKFRMFRNDKEKRDFIVCGAAAGVAATFGAPLGGVMFCLEECSSYWNPRLTWRTLFAAMIAAFIAETFRSIFAGGQFGSISRPSILAFGDSQGENHSYQLWEVPFFVALGCLGGLLGALFNSFNRRLVNLRARLLKSRTSRIAEALLLSACMAAFTFGLPYAFSNSLCRDRDRPQCPGDSDDVRSHMIQFYCKDGQYDELATLTFNGADSAIKFLFHTPSAGFGSSCNMDPWALLVFFCPYVTMACWCYAAYVPAGLFLPSILSGATFGRLYGHFVSGLIGAIGLSHASHGMYSLIGGAAMLGGNLRYTISITVIFIETTGDAMYGLPVFLTALAARWTANNFNRGIFLMSVTARKMPFLPWEAPVWYNRINAADIMSKNLIMFREFERAGDLVAKLKGNNHHGFAVVRRNKASKARNRYRLVGSVLRKHICVALTGGNKKKVLRSVERKHGSAPRLLRPPDGGHNLTLRDLEGCYPRYPEARDVELNRDEEQKMVDLRALYNPTPHTVRPMASATHVYEIFRQLGLRHCYVVTGSGCVVGIITRQDLTIEHCKQCLEHVRGRSQFSIQAFDTAKSDEICEQAGERSPDLKRRDSGRMRAFDNLHMHDGRYASDAGLLRSASGAASPATYRNGSVASDGTDRVG